MGNLDERDRSTERRDTRKRIPWKKIIGGVTICLMLPSFLNDTISLIHPSIPGSEKVIASEDSFYKQYQNLKIAENTSNRCLAPDSNNGSPGRVYAGWLTTTKSSAIYDERGDNIKFHILPDTDMSIDRYVLNVRATPNESCKLVITADSKFKDINNREFMGKTFTIGKNTYALAVEDTDKKNKFAHIALYYFE